mmetsp:Transcript_41945/g.96253  ORF Transcript_41945/g.96253 Transcript_41945/m.96253 type:complete len:445 (+) Transcript_41945:82-1416(+)
MASVVKISRGAETVRLAVEGELTFESLSALIAQSWPDASVGHAVYKDKAGVLQPIMLADFHAFLDSAEVSSAGKRLWRIDLALAEAESVTQEAQIEEHLAAAVEEGLQDIPGEQIESEPVESCAAASLDDAETRAPPRQGYARAELKEARDTSADAVPVAAEEAHGTGQASAIGNPLENLRVAVRRIATGELPTWQETKEELSTRLNWDSWRRKAAGASFVPRDNQEVVPQVVADILVTFDANQDGFLNFEECLELQKSLFGRDLHPDTYIAFCCRFGSQPTRGLSAGALTNILCGAENSNPETTEVSNTLRDIEGAKEEAVLDLIMTFDSNEDGYLNFEDCKELQAALFEGKLWEATYKDLCHRLSADPEIGLGPQALSSILVSQDSRQQAGGATATIFNRDFIRANRQVADEIGGPTFQGLAEHVLRIPGVIGAATRTMRYS